MARTKERESLFQWVGPIVENRWILVGLKERGLAVRSLEQARQLKTIGVVREFAWTEYLEARAFRNLEEVVRNGQNVMKLLAGRIDAYVSNDNSWIDEIKAQGQDPARFELVWTIESVQLYIAHSRGTDPAVVARWQSALDAMKRDGSFTKIFRAWFPARELPGPARPAAF
jgi:polar amino acid transport system substrate-binding protein